MDSTGLFQILRDIRPTHAVINLQALEGNIHAIRSHIGERKIMAIVKANAYGHGILEVSQCAVQSGVDYIGVGFLEEGIFLRQNDIDAPILVMGGILGYQVKKFIQNDLEITVSSLELAQHIDSESGSQKARVHLKIDTGMERIGVTHKYAVEFVRRVAMLKHIDIVGIYSHFATADEADKSFAAVQLERFESILTEIQKIGIDIPVVHMANSGATADIPDSKFTMVRPGLMIYGLYPSKSVSRTIKLNPVLSLTSKVVFIKRVPEKTGISYGLKYFTESATNIVTIPIGYGDGYSRLLTNKGEVLIRGKKYPIVGAVCMNQVMVNVGNDNIQIGDEVVLVGRSGNEMITANDIAEKLGTIPYEITCMINARVPRIYVRR